ncbi:hypothetical protein MTR67_013977 [Solanum verrucosum]|uniref:Uncharacterized protein n=1 Tax=Solanum verrucosum TaxID=315347 RepID=A0AAF0QBE2_SOLVR|nr:hypothetical protein MTR67_013977 [Solanum verrucosum]
MGNHPSQKIPISLMPHSSSTRNGFSDPRMDSPFKTTKWYIKGSDFVVFLNKAKEKSDSAMAADTSLQLKALTRSPCQDTCRSFLIAVIEHSLERKQSIIIAPLQHQPHKEQRKRRRRGRRVVAAVDFLDINGNHWHSRGATHPLRKIPISMMPHSSSFQDYDQLIVNKYGDTLGLKWGSDVFYDKAKEKPATPWLQTPFSWERSLHHRPFRVATPRYGMGHLHAQIG